MDPTTGTRDDKFINLVQRDSDRYEWQAFLDKVKKLGHKEREDFIPNNAGMPSGYFKKTVAASKKVMALRETHRITSFGLEAAESITPNAIIGRISQGMQVFLKEEKKTATILSEVRGEYGYKVKIEDGRIVNRDMHEFVVMTKDSNLQQLNENPWEVRDPKKTKDPVVKKNTLDEAMSSFLKEEKEFSIQEAETDHEFDAIDRLEKATIPTHICTQDFWTDKYGADAEVLVKQGDEVQYDAEEGAIGIVKGSAPGMVVHLDPQEFESHFKSIGKQSIAGKAEPKTESEGFSPSGLLIEDETDEWEVIRSIESRGDLQVDADFEVKVGPFGVEIMPNNLAIGDEIKEALNEAGYDYKSIGGFSEEPTDGDDDMNNIKEKADDNFDNYDESTDPQQLDELLAFTRRGKIDMITGFGDLANIKYTKLQLDALSDKEINTIYKQVTKDPRVTYMVSEDVQDSKNAIAKALAKKKSLAEGDLEVPKNESEGSQDNVIRVAVSSEEQSSIYHKEFDDFVKENNIKIINSKDSTSKIDSGPVSVKIVTLSDNGQFQNGQEFSDEFENSVSCLFGSPEVIKSKGESTSQLNEGGIGFDAIADEIFSKFQNDPNWEIEAKKFLEGMMLQQSEITDILNILRGEEYFDSGEFSEGINESVEASIQDDLKTNFRSFESDCDNKEDIEALIFQLSMRHPNEDEETIKQLAYDWTGYQESDNLSEGNLEEHTLDNYFGNTYSTAEGYTVYFADRYIELINPDGETYFDQYDYPEVGETSQGSQSECSLTDDVLEFSKNDKLLATLNLHDMKQAMDESDDDDDDSDEDLEGPPYFFYVESNGDGAIIKIGYPSRGNGSGNYREYLIRGEEPYGFGSKTYQSYLTQDDIESWLRKDYKVVEPIKGEADFDMFLPKNSEDDSVEEPKRIPPRREEEIDEDFDAIM